MHFWPGFFLVPRMQWFAISELHLINGNEAVAKGVKAKAPRKNKLHNLFLRGA
jgi:hypothetical protein